LASASATSKKLWRLLGVKFKVDLPSFLSSSSRQKQWRMVKAESLKRERKTPATMYEKKAMIAAAKYGCLTSGTIASVITIVKKVLVATMTPLPIIVRIVPIKDTAENLPPFLRFKKNDSLAAVQKLEL
jgi:hypothetical protein